MTVKPLLTAEELSALPEVPNKRFALVHGALIEVPAAGMQRGLEQLAKRCACGRHGA